MWKVKCDGADIDKEKAKEKTQDIFFASVYYERLAKENKDVTYYGDKVTVEDTNKVLIRWRISNNEYRVIFGNLTTKTVNSEQLAKLEKLSSK